MPSKRIPTAKHCTFRCVLCGEGFLACAVRFLWKTSHSFRLPFPRIQNFNEGMRDDQVLHLLRILQMPSCSIWCLNIGETYNVKTKTWKLFAKGLKKTKITHMYASEHTISTELKDQIRATIRDNRSKHDMHCNPDNLDVIVQCTHCWWNPINTKSLRPYIRQRGYEQILNDKEGQGLPGTKSRPAGDAGKAIGDILI